jgi:hypothetical protein
MNSSEADLDIEDALTLKRAETWLEVGRPILALDEMEGLGEHSMSHPWAVRLLGTICTASPQQPAGEACPPVVLE